jgi:AcrR family transcriptional regulator
LSREPLVEVPSFPTSGAQQRRPRADAARNREAILAAARETFVGSAEDLSLEGIARAAGVGIGTLYRHFPTRHDLVAAVYGSELDNVLASVEPLLEGHDAETALRGFLRRYADFIATKRGMAQSLQAMSDRASSPAQTTRERVTAAMGAILGAGVEQGLFRADVSADDVTAAMVGIFLSTADSADDGQALRLLELLVRGLRSAAA